MFNHQTKPDNSRLDFLLKEIIDLTGADKGIIQLYNERTETLNVVSSFGAGQEFLMAFNAVKAFDPTACGRCLGLKIPIDIQDTLFDTALYPFKQIIDQENIRSAKSIPLFRDRDKRIAGVFSIYFSKQLHLMPNSGKIPVTQITEITLLIKELSMAQV